MRSTLVVLCLLFPALVLGQSLSEVARKEKERREKNKQEGKKALVISEEQLSPKEDEASEGDSSEEPAGPSTAERPSPSGREESEYNEEDDYVDESDAPTFISADQPMEERLEAFEKMKRAYQRKVRDIDESIAENEERLRQIETQIAATSALGGAGLPVAPQTGTGTAMKPMTGQESAQLVAEQKRLQTMTQTLRDRKKQLKLDLVAKGRAGGIPAGYLRF